MTSHTNLRRDPESGSSGAAVYLDTDRGDGGPEFVFVGTRTDGSSTGLVDWLGGPRSLTRWVA